MDVLQEIEAIMEEIRNAKPVPFSASAMINKQDLLERLESIRQNAPEELKQARWVMRDREDLLGRTQKDAEQIIAEARAERDRMLARTEIVNAAHREAERIIEEATARGRKIQMEAEDYVDGKLANFEVVLQKTMQSVSRGRESLRGRLDGAVEVDEDLVDEEPLMPPETQETGSVRRIRRRNRDQE